MDSNNLSNILLSERSRQDLAESRLDLDEISPDLVQSDGFQVNFCRIASNIAGFCMFLSKNLRISSEVSGFMIGSGCSGFGRGKLPTDPKASGIVGDDPPPIIGMSVWAVFDSDSGGLVGLVRSEQELRFFKQFLAVFGFSVSFLLALVGLKYQNSDGALFHDHRVIMVLLIIDVCTGTTALAMVTLPTFRNSSLFLFEIVCLISEVFACDLLLLILVPPFGVFMFIICAFGLVYILYGAYLKILNSYQEILKSMRQEPSQTSNKSLMLAPNETEIQVAEMT
uniref:Uncharacterized protein n=1 Tax=Quercus lobata TaxID=97700 RepID=A0A7N2N057_QUELO